MPHEAPSGGAARWGPLFGARARDWAETWEAVDGWGRPVYQHVIDRAEIGSGTQVLDCGCGAGRFARMAADHGSSVAGVDAAEQLVAIAKERTPDADFQVADLEALPWPDASFDVVTGFSAFQFADDKVRALAEARRVSRGLVVVVIPSRVPDSGITAVFSALVPLFPPAALQGMKQSGMFALSEPGRLDHVVAAAGLRMRDDDEIACPISFANADEAVRAFLGAGPMIFAISHAGEPAVAEAVRVALEPVTGAGGRVRLPAWYRAVLASS